MVWVNPNEPFPDEPTRHALSDRLHVHVVHHDREEERDEEEEARARGRAPLTSAELDRFRMIMEQERQQMVEEVATNNGPLGMRSEPQPDIDRAQDLEMVATHASVEGLRLPPDLIALAYDRNDGDIVNAIMNLTEPIFRSQLERELAERQAEAAEEEVVEEEEAEDDFEEDLQARQRELDLWLLESQVPGCTRERAERAYEQGREDVTRALPLARMATLLADRETMVEFLMEQLPGSLREEACACYYEAEGDVVDAIVNLQREARHRLNQPVLSQRSKQRLRIRTVFMLALLYRERYGQLDRQAEEALAQVPIEGRSREGSPRSFVTADGSRWTHTRQEGWERRVPPALSGMGRAVSATEPSTPPAALSERSRAHLDHSNEDAWRNHEQTVLDAPDIVTRDYRRLTPRQVTSERLRRRQQLHQAHANLDDAIRRGTSEDAWRNYADIIAERQRATENDRATETETDGTPSPQSPLPAPALRRSNERARLVHTADDGIQNWAPVFLLDEGAGRGPPIRGRGQRLARGDPDWWPDRDSTDADSNEDGEEAAPTLVDASSSSAEEEDHEDEEGNERPTAGTYARPRPFMHSQRACTRGTNSGTLPSATCASSRSSWTRRWPMPRRAL